MPLRTISFLIAAAVLAPLANAGDWPQFLGPDRNGISAETALINSWPEGGPKELWRVKGGPGMSGLAIRADRLVTLLERNGKQLVVALDATTGKSVWERAAAPAYRNQMGNGPRATPTLLKDSVYAFTGEGILVALRFSDGMESWRHDVVKELGGKPAEYGMASSPLVAGPRVIVTAGAPNATVVAYDRASGELAWTSGADRAGYSSASLLEVGGREQIVVFSGTAALGLAPDSGNVLWRYPFETDFDCNITTPLEHDGKVFLSSGESHGSVLLALVPKGGGDTFSVKEVWTSFGPKSAMRNEWQTSILIDGHLYGFDNVGSAGPVTHLNCVEIATGKRVWQKIRFGKGNLIAADGKLFFSTFKGELVVGRATPKGYEEIGRKKVTGPTRQAPSLSGGLLYLRDDREIVCFDLRKP